MKKMILLLIVLLIPATSLFAGKLNVVTSIPDIANMVEEIGGDRVRVTALATGREDLHAVPARPSFLPLLNRADVVISLGLDAEHAWLPALVREARNPDIVPGKHGWVQLNDGVTVLQVPDVLSRSEGEQHPEGNPHFNIGPHEGITMASNILDALIHFDPDGETRYNENYAAYEAKLNEMVISLKSRGASLANKKLIAYHEDLSYICEFYGIEQIGTIEVKPGVPPTASHLHHLEQDAENIGAEVIVHNQAQSERVPNRLGEKLGIPVVEIANAVGAQSEITTWIGLQHYNLGQLLEAFSE